MVPLPPPFGFLRGFMSRTWTPVFLPLLLLLFFAVAIGISFWADYGLPND
jgi:hypothetical protein